MKKRHHGLFSSGAVRFTGSAGERRGVTSFRAFIDELEESVHVRFLAGRPNLSPSDQATFDGMSAKLKLAQ